MSRKDRKPILTAADGPIADLSAQDALIGLLREGAVVYQDSRDRIMTGDDPEHVHSARVALRRSRSLLRGFAEMLAPAPRDRLATLLADRFRELGPMRDADVHAMALAATPMAAAAVQAAAGQRSALRAVLADPDRQRLPREIDVVFHETARVIRGARRQRLARAPVTLMASRALHLAWTELLAFGPDLDRLSPVELHDLRKRAKDMRYLSDFFGARFPGKRKGMARSLARLQDALGTLNDLATMRLGQDQVGVPMLPEDAERIEARSRKSARKAWKKLRRQPAWWGAFAG